MLIIIHKKKCLFKGDNSSFIVNYRAVSFDLSALFYVSHNGIAVMILCDKDTNYSQALEELRRV